MEARPWDNIDRLERIDERNGHILLDLGNGWCLSLRKGAKAFPFKDSLFLLAKETELRIGGVGKRYDAGVVVFIRENQQDGRLIYDLYEKLNAALIQP